MKYTCIGCTYRCDQDGNAIISSQEDGQVLTVHEESFSATLVRQNQCPPALDPTSHWNEEISIEDISTCELMFLKEGAHFRRCKGYFVRPPVLQKTRGEIVRFEPKFCRISS